MRRAAKTDINHRELVDAMRNLGLQVLDLSRVGGGVPDTLVRFQRMWTFVEIKAGKGKQNPAQVAFAGEWPVRVIRSVDDVVALVTALRG